MGSAARESGACCGAWACRRSSNGPGRLSRTRCTGSTHACCAPWRSRGRIRGGVRTCRTFRWRAACSTGPRARRTVVAWRLSNTLDSSFCVAALPEALDRSGSPEIFKTDQGRHCTSLACTDVRTDAGIHSSMDGTGHWMEHVRIERLRRSLKYEPVYLAEYATASEARAGIGWWIDVYNERRPHSSLGDRTPAEVYTLGGALRPGLCPASSQPDAA